MNPETPEDWNDLARLWQAESAAISVDEIEHYLQRERARLRLLSGVELAGLGMGVAVGVWIALVTQRIWFSGFFVVLCALTAWFSRGKQAEQVPAGNRDLLSSLRSGLSLEQDLVARLRIGRTLSFLALGGMLYLLARELVVQGSFGAAPFLLPLTAATWLVAVIGWNLILTRLARLRQRRLEQFAVQLKGGA